MASSESEQKFGAGSLSAMARIGVHELRNALYPESNVAQGHSEYGLWASPTPGMVASAIEPNEGAHAEPNKSNEVHQPSILAERLQRMATMEQEDRGRESPSIERE